MGRESGLAYPMTIDPPEMYAVHTDEPVVLVVDDDDLMLAALRRVFASAKLKAELYSSGQDFLTQARLDRAGCIILDVCMPGMDGLEVQVRLKQRGVDTPVIFLTGADGTGVPRPRPVDQRQDRPRSCARAWNRQSLDRLLSHAHHGKDGGANSRGPGAHAPARGRESAFELIRCR